MNHAKNIIHLLAGTPRSVSTVGDFDTDEEAACIDAGGMWDGTQCLEKLTTGLDNLDTSGGGKTSTGGGTPGGGKASTGGGGTPTPEVKTSVTAESKGMKYLKIGAGLLVGAAVVGGGAYYLTKKKKH